jgi:hypothetical protein
MKKEIIVVVKKKDGGRGRRWISDIRCPMSDV